MAYQRHEMNVILFSKKDDVFADEVGFDSDNDNTKDDWVTSDDDESSWGDD